MITFDNFEEALECFREIGGAMNYHFTTRTYEVEEFAEELAERINCSAKEATIIALIAGGMTESEVAEELADWID